MKIIKDHQEPIVAALTLTTIAIVFATRDTSMSDTAQTMLLIFFSVGMLSYGAFVYRESPADEREYELSLVASKHAYLLGAVLLAVGIIVQSFQHTLDAWLPGILAAMVSTKLISYFLHRSKQE